MKRIYINIMVGLFVLFTATNVAWGQANKLVASGTWEVDDTRIDVKENKTVKLTGNIAIKDKIRIYKGYKLRIENASNGNVTLTNSINGENNYLFYVEEGATLEIIGFKNKQIVIDGGANFTWKDDPVGYKYELEPGKNGKVLTSEAIASRGTLTLDYVHIHDVDAANQGGAILITGEDDGYGKAKNGPTTITNCLIEKCYAHEGSAIHITKQNNAQGTGVNKNAETCRVKIEDTTIQKCVTGNRNNPKSTNNSPGGAVRTNGNAVSNLYLTRVTMLYNRSTKTIPVGHENDPSTHGTGSGGAVYWNAHGLDATKLYIDDCTFEKNMSDGNGAGLMLEATFEFVNKTSKVHDNIAGRIGGGIVVVGYGGGADVIGHANNLTFNLTDKLSVQKNKAVNGGGIAFTFGTGMTLPAGSKITTNFIGSNIYKNTASESGGGLYFINNTTASQNYTIGINLNYGEITYNDAKNGGAMYVKKEQVNSLPTANKDLNITNNTASNHGGGIYIAEGSLSLAYGTIATNMAANNGGGICMENGAFSITQGQIMNNRADYGGGLYVYNNTDKTNTVAFGGGTISNNVAKAGGGISVDGKIALTTTNTDVIQNKATNAGGIYLNNYATMLFKGGMIRLNMAMADLDAEDFGYTTLTDRTAYQKSVGTIAGVGGGVFLDDNTTLSFEIPKDGELGLYNNRATAAADDIFANGNGTSVTLPDVSSMNLANWEGAAGRLFWAEDYYSFHQDGAFEHDAMYATDGINKATFSDPEGNLRYQFALGQLRRNHIQEVSPKEYTNYVCLVLGYEIFYVNIIKEGLKNGESAMFNIYQVGANDTAIPANAKLYLTTLLTGGEEKDGKVYRTVALPAGHWGVRENDWSYTYQPKEGTGMEEVREIKKDDDINSPNDEEKGFLFKNEEKDAKASLLHHEDKVKNIMGNKAETKKE